MGKYKFREFKLKNLFYNEKFIITLSILLSFVIWVIISSNETESRPVTISNIPIVVELSDTALSDGLRVFTKNDLRAEVSVTGNRIIVGQLTSSDIRVVAKQSSSITSPGNYTLELTPEKASSLSDYSFESGVTPGFVTVMVDKYKEIELDVEDRIKYNSDPQYFANSTIFSAPKVKISGPESEISKIKRVVAEYEVSGVLTSTKNITVPLKMYDAYGDIVTSENITLSDEYENVTIPILLKKVLPTSATFKNAPEALDDKRVSVNPDSIEIAAPESMFDSFTSVKLESLDFSKINPSNVEFDLPLDMPPGSKSINNVYTAHLKIDLKGYSTKNKVLSNFEFNNLYDNKTASVSTKKINVAVVGISDQLDKVSDQDLVGIIDMNERPDFTGTKEMPVRIKVKNHNTCWVYGEYKVTVVISDKN